MSLMPARREEAQAPVQTSGPAQRVVVWDPLVRIVHWLVALGCIANLTVLEDADEVHEYVGYAVLVAVLVRLVWGVFGSHHARYSDFVATPRELFIYIRMMLRGREPRYLGHNPAGAVMMTFLIVLVIVCAVSGWMMGLDRFWGELWVQLVHEWTANLILLGALLHVAGAIVESYRHRENLILSMITGRKRAPAGSDVCNAPE
jgi:cytochrome b